MATRTPSYSLTTKAGWIAIYLGILVWLFAGVAYLILQFGGFVPDLSTTGTPWALAHSKTMVAIQVVVGLAAMVAGAAILKRRLWARSVLEGLCWTTTVEMVLLAFGLNRLAGQPDSQLAIEPGTPLLMVAIISSAGALSYIVAAVLAIRALRSPAMYDALEGVTATESPAAS